ncbi:ExbD/TolR family protein [candidate division KSB1 bacterium]
MKVEKKIKAHKEVNLASMPDIVFLLLFFFMVSAVFKKVQGIPVVLPTAEKIQKIESRRHISYLFISIKEDVIVDDMVVNLQTIPDLMYAKVVENPQLLTLMKIDKNVKMSIVHDVQSELRKGQCLRINYAANYKN